MISMIYGDTKQRAGAWRHGASTAVISCPRCAAEFTIHENEIHEQGTTDHTRACPNPECSWEDFVKLVGWGDPEEG